MFLVLSSQGSAPSWYAQIREIGCGAMSIACDTVTAGGASGPRLWNCLLHVTSDVMRDLWPFPNGQCHPCRSGVEILPPASSG